MVRVIGLLALLAIAIAVFVLAGEPTVAPVVAWASKLRSWVRAATILVAIAALWFLIRIGYAYQWTGFGKEEPKPEDREARPKKTLWDWLQLLVVPIALVLITVTFTWRQTAYQQKVEDQRAKDELELTKQRAQDEALQAYLDQTSTLLLEHDLRDSAPDSEVRTIAQTRTLSLLDTVDKQRRRTVLRFLYEANLIDRPNPEIKLEGANLQNMDLRRANLSGGAFDITSTYGTDRNAEFGTGGVDLSGANLAGTNLKYGALNGVNLEGANFHKANLYGCGFAPDFSNVSEGDKSPPRDYRRLTPPDAADVTLTIPVRLSLPKGTVVPNLQGVFFNDAKLQFAVFANADLTGADFIDANMRHSWLVDADLRHTSFRNADLTDASLSFASMDSDTNFERADLTGAYLYHVDGLDVDKLAEQAKSLKGVTMPNGQKYEEWLKDKESREEDGENSSPS